MLPPPFESILLPTDLEPPSHRAFDHALLLALQTRGTLRVLHVYDGTAHKAFPHVRERLTRWGRIRPEDEDHAVSALGVEVTRLETNPGDPVDRIVKDVEKHTPDLIVMATHGREGLLRLLSRNVAEPVMRKAHTPTLLLAPSAKGFVSEWGEVDFGRVLVPVSKSPDPQLALEGAVRLVRSIGVDQGEIRVLHVGTEATLPTLRLPEVPGWTVSTVTVDGDVVEQVLLDAAAMSAQCIVMTTQGHDSAGDVLFGSKAERVAREAPCPVLILPVAS
jgi:nucleotide-binding universal stress UspA family protein